LLSNDDEACTSPKPGKQIPRENWLKSISDLQGLDGIDIQSASAVGYSDPVTEKEHLAFERRRGYRFEKNSNDENAKT